RPDKSWYSAPKPEQLREACESNLRNLRLERLDLVHFRYMDGSEVPLTESLGALIDLRTEGKIRHIGVSNVDLAQLREAQSITTIASVQNLYNLQDRKEEELFEACTEDGIPFMPFFP